MERNYEVDALFFLFEVCSGLGISGIGGIADEKLKKYPDPDLRGLDPDPNSGYEPRTRVEFRPGSKSGSELDNTGPGSNPNPRFEFWPEIGLGFAATRTCP